MTDGSGAFVGRKAELVALVAAVRRPDGLLLVSGEAGVGKSRLILESLRDATAPVAWATCWQGDGVPAFWPWTQVIRSCLGTDAGTEWRRTPTPGVAAMLSLLPEEGEDQSRVEASRFALFEAVVDLLRAVAAPHGLVVVIDDLQWSDEASVRLLAFAARNLSGGPVQFVGAYRDDEVGPDHPLSACIAELTGRVRQIDLRGLEVVDMAALSAQFGSHVSFSDEQLSDLHALTAGNPFFVREMLALEHERKHRSGHPRVPVGVRAVIEQRLARLASNCDEVLKVAAVIGASFAADDVAAAMDEPVTSVLLALDDAVQAHAVVADDTRPGWFRFSHDLMRETIYASMPQASRASAHQRVAEVFEAAGGEASPAALAHHLIGAVPLVDRARAVEAAMGAGREAMAVHAYEDAGEWFERALSLVYPLAQDELAALVPLFALGEARLRANDLPAARDAYIQAADIARRHGRPDDLALAALGLGAGLEGFEVALFDRAQIDLLEAALSSLADGDSPLRARLLARLSVAVSFVAEEDRRRWLSAEAVAMARRLGDRSVLGHALAAHCDAISGPAHCEERRERAAEIVALACDVGDLRLELLGRRLLIVALLELGEIGEVDTEIRSFSAAAETVREPLYRWYVPLWRGMRALMAGRVSESAALCEDAEALGALAGSVNAVMLTLTQRWVRLRVEGRMAEAAALMEEKGPEVFGELAGTYAVGAWSDIYLGNRDRARSILHSFTDNLARVPMDAEWLPTVAQLAEIAVVLQDHTAAAALDTAMAPFDGRVVVEGIGAAVYGTLGQYRALLAEVLGDEEATRRLATDAAATAQRMGLVGVPRVSTHECRDGDAVAPRARGPHTASARRDEAIWELTFGGVTCQVRDSKGLRDLAVLLARPGSEVHVTELTGGDHGRVVATSRGDEVLDRRALADFKRRIDELDVELAEAESHHDEGRIGKVTAEREFLLAELSSAAGFGGRRRRLGDNVDRERKAVRARVRDAIARIGAEHADLGRHLTRAVRTGTFCSYDPEIPVHWTVEP